MSDVKNYNSVIGGRDVNASEINLGANEGPSKQLKSDGKKAEQKTDVFISFTTMEEPLAQFLASVINFYFPSVASVFVSSSAVSIPAGSDSLSRTEAALNSAGVQLVLASKLSLSKHWVNFEIGAAWARGVPIIFLCHGGVSKDQLPLPYRSRQALNLDAELPEESLLTLLEHLELVLSVSYLKNRPTTLMAEQLHLELDKFC